MKTNKQTNNHRKTNKQTTTGKLTKIGLHLMGLLFTADNNTFDVANKTDKQKSHSEERQTNKQI